MLASVVQSSFRIQKNYRSSGHFQTIQTYTQTVTVFSEVIAAMTSIYKAVTQLFIVHLQVPSKCMKRKK